MDQQKLEATSLESPTVHRYLELAKEHETYEVRLQKALEHRERFSEKILLKVTSDYRLRMDELTSEMNSLAGDLQGETRTLEERLSKLRTEQAQYTERFEELELRHLTGELSQDEYTKNKEALEAEHPSQTDEADLLERQVQMIRDLLAEQTPEQPEKEPEPEPAVPTPPPEEPPRPVAAPPPLPATVAVGPDADTVSTAAPAQCQPAAVSVAVEVYDEELETADAGHDSWDAELAGMVDEMDESEDFDEEALLEPKSEEYEEEEYEEEDGSWDRDELMPDEWEEESFGEAEDSDSMGAPVFVPTVDPEPAPNDGLADGDLKFDVPPLKQDESWPTEESEADYAAVSDGALDDALDDFEDYSEDYLDSEVDIPEELLLDEDDDFLETEADVDEDSGLLESSEALLEDENLVGTYEDEAPADRGVVKRPRRLQPVVIFRENQADEKVFYITGDSMSIGRGPDNDIQLATDTSVSRHHSRITFEGDEYWISDLGSSNGTIVNGELITKTVLTGDDEVSIGQTVLKFKFR